MIARNDLLSAVKALQDAANRHAIDEVMAMFADDAEFELEGVARVVGKKQIRSIFEYDTGVNGKIELINCNVTADTVNCQLVEINDRLRLASVDRLVYPSCVLFFKNSLIHSWRATPDPEAVRAFGRFWNAARQWISRHFPTDYSRLFTPDGSFIRSRENGERSVELGKKYLSTGAP